MFSKKHCVKLLLDYRGNKDANSVENVKLNSGIYVKVCNNGSLFKINFFQDHYFVKERTRMAIGAGE